MTQEHGTAEAPVLSVSLDSGHRFSKILADTITLAARRRVDGNAHAAAMVQHLSRRAEDPEQPTLREIHLIPAELFDELHDEGFEVAPEAHASGRSARSPSQRTASQKRSNSSSTGPAGSSLIPSA